METPVTRNEFDTLKAQVSKLDTRMSVAERDIQDINKKLDKIDNNTTWILRLIIGALIMSVLGVILVQGGGM